MSEFITLFCTVGGTIIAYLAYRQTTNLKELKKVTLEKFHFLREINADLTKELYSYGLANDAFDLPFMQGITLKQCIEILTRVKNGILTNESYSILQESKSKMRIEEIKANFDIQIKHHSEVKTAFDYYIK